MEQSRDELREEHIAMTVNTRADATADRTERSIWAEPYSLRVPQPAERPRLEAIWAASQDADDPAFRPHDGWWSLAEWAAMCRLLVHGAEPIGVVALNVVADGDASEVRLALLPAYRSSAAGERLLQAARVLTQTTGLHTLRLYLPAAATWATRPAAAHGFHPIRAFHAMLRPAGAEAPSVPEIAGIRIRPIRPGEEARVLAAINQAWQGTYNFHPISRERFLLELHNQRDGFLVAVDATDETRIAGTVHARFDPGAYNPDGPPYAWIANLTTGLDWRGRGLGRALLLRGLEYLRRRGARSIALGVDGGNPVPVRLYHATGFRTISSLEVWEGQADGTSVAHPAAR